MNKTYATGGFIGFNTRNLLGLLVVAFIAIFVNEASAQQRYVQYPQRYGPNSGGCRQQHQHGPRCGHQQQGGREHYVGGRLFIDFGIGFQRRGGSPACGQCQVVHQGPCRKVVTQQRRVGTCSPSRKTIVSKTASAKECVTYSIYVNKTPYPREETNAAISQARSLNIPQEGLQGWLNQHKPGIIITVNSRKTGSTSMVRREEAPQGYPPTMTAPQQGGQPQRSGWVGDTYYKPSSGQVEQGGGVSLNAPIWPGGPDYREAPGVGRAQVRLVPTSTGNYVWTASSPEAYAAGYPGMKYVHDIGTVQRAERERDNPGYNPYGNNRRF